MNTTKTKRQCFWVDPIQKWNPHLKTRGFVPSLVTEGEPGHSPMTGATGREEPWYWGMTIEEAERTVESVNKDRGITALEALKIVASSMGGSRP